MTARLAAAKDFFFAVPFTARLRSGPPAVGAARRYYGCARASFEKAASSRRIPKLIVAQGKLDLVMAAEGIAFYAVLRAPRIGHLTANFPQLRKKFVAHAFGKYFHWTALQRF